AAPPASRTLRASPSRPPDSLIRHVQDALARLGCVLAGGVRIHETGPLRSGEPGVRFDRQPVDAQVGRERMARMGAAQNKATVVAAYEAFGTGDIAAVIATNTPDAVWVNYSTPASPLSGEHKGLDNIGAFFGL